MKQLFELGESVKVYNLGGYLQGIGTIIEVEKDDRDIWYTIKIPDSKYRMLYRQALDLLRRVDGETDTDDR